MTLPVWMYWEGPCPEWIRECQDTVFRHGGDVRLLGPADFDRIRDVDRDIDLTGLRIAHRADFIRAFLLATYGGIWVDSDCIVMHSLDPVIELLTEYDFVAHFERFGRVSNGFLASRPGGTIARSYYSRLCHILRSGKPLWWLALGAEALMATLGETPEPWYRLACELVQPVCWSEPEAFFRTGPDSLHASLFNPRSICYMLAHNMIQWYITEHPGADLTTPGTFFSYLLERSRQGGQSDVVLRQEGQPLGGETHPTPWRHLSFAVRLLLEVDPSRVLDVGTRFGRWGALVREFCDERHGRRHRENWRTRVERIAPAEATEEYQWLLYDAMRVGDPADLLEKMDDHWDLIVMEEALPGVSDERACRVLERALRLSDYVIVVVSGSRRTVIPGSAQVRAESWPTEGQEEELSAVLLSLSDPRGLRAAPSAPG